MPRECAGRLGTAASLRTEPYELKYLPFIDWRLLPPSFESVPTLRRQAQEGRLVSSVSKSAIAHLGTACLSSSPNT